MTGVEDLVRGRPPASRTSLWAGRVSKVTAAGAVYVTPDGGDERAPKGPCFGARYRPVTACPDGPHIHPLVPLPVGTRVLLGDTPSGPWVMSWEEPG